MNAFEFNKIAAAVLIGVLVYKVIEITAESAFHDEEAATHVVAQAEESAASVVEAAATAPAVVDEGPSLAAMMATASADGGSKLFRRCQACHSIAKGEGHKTGPNLYGVMGSQVGGRFTDFNYSGALADFGAPWTVELMDAYLTSPKEAIPGNKMSFGGLRKAGDRATLIAYMNSFSDAPLSFAMPSAIPEEMPEEMSEEIPDVDGAGE